MPNTFTWKTKFKSIIIVDGELFQNQYNAYIHITPYTANLKEQTRYFERLKHLFEIMLITIENNELKICYQSSMKSKSLS